MDKVFILIFILTITCSFGQSKNDRHDRITKEEFQELLKDRDNFVPADIDTVIIVKYSGQKLLQMQNNARNIGFARNGTDTTGLKNESWLTEKQIKKNKQRMEDFSSEYPIGLKKKLKEKGIPSVIVDESELTENKAYFNKYWLKTTFISTQKSLEDNGWVMTTTNLFFDPKSNKDFETFLPLNYNLLDLVK
jgi:hypothetical protein